MKTGNRIRFVSKVGFMCKFEFITLVLLSQYAMASLQSMTDLDKILGATTAVPFRKVRHYTMGTIAQTQKFQNLRP